MRLQINAIAVLLAGVLLYTIGVLGFALASYFANDRHLVYALDDAYIHMAIAKHLATYGVFGITPYEFSSSSSSPLWTGLLSGVYYFWGISAWSPLFLNYVFGVATILIGWKLGRDAGMREAELGLLLLAIILLTPMVPLTFTGMEHLLHLFAILLVVHFLYRVFESDMSPKPGVIIGLAVSTAIAVSARYESLFLAGASAVAVGAKRYWAAVATIIGCAALPVILFGSYLTVNDQQFLPNSVLLKGNLPHTNSFVGVVNSLGLNGIKQLESCNYLFALIVSLLLLFSWRRAIGQDKKPGDLVVIVTVAAVFLHLQYAKTGWFYRYEAYLVALCLTILIIEFYRSTTGQEDLKPRRRVGSRAGSVEIVLAAMVAVLLIPVTGRALRAHVETVRATTNIYEQQYQMSRFIRQFYEGASIAANDVGAVNYYSQIKCLDLWGLGSREVTLHKLHGTYTTEVIRELVRGHGCKIVVVYQPWFRGKAGLPEEWTLVGRWVIHNNVVCGCDTVSFLAPEQCEVPKLRDSLRSFARELPCGVVWEEAGTRGE